LPGPTTKKSEEFHGFKMNGPLTHRRLPSQGAAKTAEIRRDETFTSAGESFAQHREIF
jgi:hypothetical protein